MNIKTNMNILTFGTTPKMGTGYGIVLRHLNQNLKKKGYNVHQLGMYHIGEIDESLNLEEDERKQLEKFLKGEPIDKQYKDIILDKLDKIYPLLPVGEEQHGMDKMEQDIIMFNIDLLITFCDIWHPHFHYIPEVVKKTGVKWIHHLTLNSFPASPLITKWITHADHIVVPSDFCYDLITKAGFENVSMIPHGINTKVFKPFDKEKIKQLRKKFNEKEDDFIFFTIARNTQYQKGYPDLLEAFKIFLENEPGAKDNCKLHMHNNPNEPGGYPLMDFLTYQGLNDYTSITGFHRTNFTLPPKDMAEIVNMFDCFVIGSHGESFCYPLVESMACGKPVIAPDFSAMKDHMDKSKAGLAARIRGKYWTPILDQQVLVDTLDMAKKMGEIYNNRELGEKLGKKGVKYAKSLDWDKVMPKWFNLLDTFDMSKDKPLVSAMVLTHNRKEWVKEQIDSLLAQTYPNIEIIVVDDGSTDGTYGFLEKEYKDKIKLYKNETNQGCPKSRNIALKHSTGKYIAICDSDDINLPRRFEDEVCFLENNPKINLVTGAMSIIQDGKEQTPPPLGSNLPISFEVMIKEHAIPSPCVMFRKAVTDELGGFDEDIPIASDRDLWLKILQKGSAIFLDKLFVKYRIHTDNLSIKNVELREKCVKKILAKYGVGNMAENEISDVAESEIKKKESKKDSGEKKK